MARISELDTSVALDDARTPSAVSDVAYILQSFFGKDLGLEVLKRLLNIEMVSAKANIRTRLAAKLGALGYQVVQWSYSPSDSQVVTGGMVSARLSMYAADARRRHQGVPQYHSHSSMAALILGTTTTLDRLPKCIGVCLDGVPVSWLFVDYGEKTTLSSSYHTDVRLDPKHCRLYESTHDGTVVSVTLPLPWLRHQASSQPQPQPQPHHHHAVAALSYPLYLSVQRLEREESVEGVVVKIEDCQPSLGHDFAAAHRAFVEGRRWNDSEDSCSEPIWSLIWDTVDNIGDRLSFALRGACSS